MTSSIDNCQSASVNSNQTDAEFPVKLLENLSNFAGSFAQSAQQVAAVGLERPGETYLPVSVFGRWLQQVQRRLMVDPTFLRR